MKAALFSVLASLIVLTGCQSPAPQFSGSEAPVQSAGVEFKRPSRVYEQGDALFAVMNNSTRVLWFEGQGPEEPAYRLKMGGAIGPEQNVPVKGPDGTAERFPLPPGEYCYFDISAADAGGQVASVGVTFYTSRTATNGFTMWSNPAPLPAKIR